MLLYITEAVHMSHKDITDSDITEYASKWLAQATVRIGREKETLEK